MCEKKENACPHADLMALQHYRAQIAPTKLSGDTP